MDPSQVLDAFIYLRHPQRNEGRPIRSVEAAVCRLAVFVARDGRGASAAVRADTLFSAAARSGADADETATAHRACRGWRRRALEDLTQVTGAGRSGYAFRLAHAARRGSARVQCGSERVSGVRWICDAVAPRRSKAAFCKG